jgi:hypothetical protein
MMHRRRLRKLGIAAAFVVGAVIVAGWVLRPADTAGPCTVLGGFKMLPEVPEASGLAVGRRDPSVLWTHNDSGSEPVLFALDSSGIVHGRVRVPIGEHDWEDL